MQPEAPIDTVWPAETCVVRYAIERHAYERPNAIFAVFEDGSEWTYSQVFEDVLSISHGLQKLGIKKGDKVLLMLPNSKPAIQSLLAIQYMGAVSVPVNTAYKGNILKHVLDDSLAQTAIVHKNLINRFEEFNSSVLETIICTERPTSKKDLKNTIKLKYFEDLLTNSRRPVSPDKDITPWDLQNIIYTSGTTGLSKGVLSTYMHSFTACNPSTWTPTNADDRHLLHMPIFHIGGAFLCSMALCVGASIAVMDGFKTNTFWEFIRDKKVTVAFLLGAMASFLLKAPKSHKDRDNPLRLVFIVPLGQSGPEFQDRFNVDVYSLFNMTEISTPLITQANPIKANTCGRPRPGVDVRIVDKNDCPVGAGSVGELIIRTSAPWAMNSGYNNNAKATVEAWRNGWFHTGDAFSMDNEGDFFFVDRLKDTIRRRGENISSYEVEVELLSHPEIYEAAVVGVPSKHSEEDVLAVISLKSGRELNLEQIIHFLAPRLPHFMIPRYIRTLPGLPKTPTEKIQKNLLRDEGVTSDTWDRETAGIIISRDKLQDSK